MDRRLIYSPRAVRQIKATLKYYRENFSRQAAANLIKQISEAEPTMKDYPESGRPTAFADTRYLQVAEHKILFYTYSDERTTVLALFDTRQDPGKRPF